MASLMQPEGFEQIARKTGNSVGIEFADYPQMLVKNRFQISRYHSFRNSFCVCLAAAREHSLKHRPIQVGSQPDPARIQQGPIIFIADTGSVITVERTPKNDTRAG